MGQTYRKSFAIKPSDNPDVRKTLYELWRVGASFYEASSVTGLHRDTVSMWYGRFQRSNMVELKRYLGENFMKPEDIEYYNKNILESAKKLAEEFDLIYNKLKAKMEEWEQDENTNRDFMDAVKTSVMMLELAMKKHGFFKTVSEINAKNVTVNNITYEFNQFLADLNAEVKTNEKGETELVIPRPRPELVEAITSARKRKSVIAQA